MSELLTVFWRNGRSADRSVFTGFEAVSNGDDPTNVWCDGSVAMGVRGNGSQSGKTLSLTRDMASQVTVAFDGRLDNAAELASRLGLKKGESGNVGELGDAEFVLAAYRKWGGPFVEQLLGDFALAIWDGASQELIVARDQLGARSLHVYITDRVCVVASRLKTLMATQLIPREVNPSRVLDCLVEPLEGADYTSTLYKNVQRLPPASVLSVGRKTHQRRTYWSLRDAPVRWENSESDWLQGIHFHLRQAVDCRLRQGRVGSMLSGGIDSSAIVAHIQQLALGDALPDSRSLPCPDFIQRHPILSFAMADDDDDSADSRSSQELIAHLGLMNDRIGPTNVSELDLDEPYFVAPESPFDAFMLMAALVYARSRALGLTAVLDGIDGDLVFGMHGSYIPSLIRGGQFVAAFREISAMHATVAATAQGIAANVLNALPNSLHLWRTSRPEEMATQRCQASIVHPDFARERDIVGRFDELRRWGKPLADFRQDQATWMAHPFATVGMERYQRVANHFGIEPRHPLFDVRLLEYCVNLPWDMRTRHGWTKFGLRKSISPLVPSTVCWRNEADNLYPRVAARFLKRHVGHLADFVERELASNLAGIVDVDRVELRMRQFLQSGDEMAGLDVWQAYYLSYWLKTA